MKDNNCVFVLEVAVLSVSLKRILFWEVWSTHATYAEAVEAKRKEEACPKHGKFMNPYTRVRKYVPAWREAAPKPRRGKRT